MSRYPEVRQAPTPFSSDRQLINPPRAQQSDEAQRYRPPNVLSPPPPDPYGVNQGAAYQQHHLPPGAGPATYTPQGYPPPPPPLPSTPNPFASSTSLVDPYAVGNRQSYHDPTARYQTPAQDPNVRFQTPVHDPYGNDPYARYSTPGLSSVGMASPPPVRPPTGDFSMAPGMMPSPVDHRQTTYQLEDHGIDEHADIPLLQRRNSGASSVMPGGFVDPASNPANEETNIRYGRIPQRVPRRYKTMKKVGLYHGNLVFDCPVPSKLLDMCTNRSDREVTHLRYTAATCDPNDFLEEKYTLRQVLYDPPRRTELFIVMTMYNEEDELFARTMHGVIKNVAHLCTRDRSKTWGKEGWKKVCVPSS